MPLQNNYFVYPSVYSCNDLDGHSQEFTLPSIDDCSDTAGRLLTCCGESWNDCVSDSGCNPCYYLPFESTDFFQFQTDFTDQYNTDPTNPTDGWGTFVKAAIYTCDGTLVSDDYTTFYSRAMVAYSGSKSYQILEIDCSKVPDAFYIKFIAYNTSNVATDSYCTEHYKKVTCDEKTMILKSTYSGTDLAGNYYGSPAAFVGNNIQEFENCVRVHGFVRPSEYSLEVTTFERKNRKTEVTRRTTGVLTKLIPPFLSDYLHLTIFPGETLCVNPSDDNHDYYLFAESEIGLTDFNDMSIGSFVMTDPNDTEINHSCG